MAGLTQADTGAVMVSGGAVAGQLPLTVNLDSLVGRDKVRILTAWEALASNTRRSYEKGLAQCRAWLTAQGLSEDQLTDEMLSGFMLAESQRHPRTKTGEVKTGEVVKPGSVAIMFAAVKWYFANVREEKRDWDVSAQRMKIIRRNSEHRTRQVDGLNWSDVDRVCAFAESESSITGLRDAAMIRLMSDCLLRISEAVAVNVEDIQGNLLYIHRSKTDQEGLERNDPYIGAPTLNLIRRYKRKAGITEGALFRRVRRGDHVQSERLSVNGARDAIKLWANIAGVDGLISGHSLRVGSAVSLAQAGASVVEMQTAGRWKNSQMPSHYARAEVAERGAVARFRYGKGR